MGRIEMSLYVCGLLFLWTQSLTMPTCLATLRVGEEVLLKFMGRQFTVMVMMSDSLVTLSGFASQGLPFTGWDVSKVTST